MYPTVDPGYFFLPPADLNKLAICAHPAPTQRPVTFLVSPLLCCYSWMTCRIAVKFRRRCPECLVWEPLLRGAQGLSCLQHYRYPPLQIAEYAHSNTFTGGIDAVDHA